MAGKDEGKGKTKGPTCAERLAFAVAELRHIERQAEKRPVTKADLGRLAANAARVIED